MRVINDFMYVGSWIASTEKDISIRIAKAWSALNNLEVIWKSNMNKKLKMIFVHAPVESVLLYGSSTWTLTKALEKSLDGTYTCMLRAVQNVSWRQHLTNKELYDGCMKITDKIRERRLKHAGHSWQSKNEIISKVLLWEPTH